MTGRCFYGTGCPQVFEWGHVGDIDAVLTAVTKKLFDRLRLKIKQHDQFGDAVFFQQVDSMQHDRLVAERNHRLRGVDRKGVQAGSESTGHDDSFHRIS